MKNKKQSIKICVLSIICVIMVFLMDMLGCNYWLRSGIKIACVVATCLFCGDNIINNFKMLINIMQPLLICLCLFGLSLAGLIFTLLNRKNNNIYNSWIVHGLANVAINSIGWMLLKGVV